eukprot:c20629_g1_i1 orf=280-1575(-)
MRIALPISNALGIPILLSSPAWRPAREAETWRRTKLHGCSKSERWRASSQGFGPPSAKKKLNGIPGSNDKRSSTLQPHFSSCRKVSTELTSQIKNTETPPKDDPTAPTLTTVSNTQQEKREAGGTFEERLEAIKRSAEEKRRLEQEKMYGPIDYEAPNKMQDSKAVSFPVKVGIGIGVVVFGLIFAFGDLLPSGEMNVQKANIAQIKEKDAKDSSKLKEQLQSFVAILKVHPEDLDALEGAAVTYAELGDFSKSETTLLQLLEKKPVDVDALRLLGEVQNALGKFAESVISYRKALKVSPRSIMLWKGLAEALVLQGKPDMAVEELAAERDRLRSSEPLVKYENEDADEATMVQINLLLGKTYVEWGHISDALAVYDAIIKGNPEDFRGYLAKGILLKDQGQNGEAERMFIQARYFAPESLKLLVDRYAKR